MLTTYTRNVSSSNLNHGGDKMSQKVSELVQGVKKEIPSLTDNALESLYQYFKARYYEETYSEGLQSLANDESFQKMLSSLWEECLHKCK